jgi:hypothetical protein
MAATLSDIARVLGVSTMAMSSPRIGGVVRC